MFSWFMALLLVVGGVGFVLAMTAERYPVFWKVCKYYFAIYTVLLITGMAFSLPAHQANLALLTGMLVCTAGSAGWTLWSWRIVIHSNIDTDN